MTRNKLTAIAASTLALTLAAGAQDIRDPAPLAVETTQLATDAFSTGTLERADGALPATLWRGSDAQTLEFLLSHAPARPATPSLGEALRRTLLSPGAGPAGASPSLGGRKLLALARAGFIEEAQTVASLASESRGDPWIGRADATADLLAGAVESACQRNAGLTSGRDDPFWVRLRVVCYVETGERDAADLTLNLLREQNALSDTDDVLLTALVTGATPKTPPAIKTALNYAVTRELGLPVTASMIAKADGGVLNAIAGDDDADIALRIVAAQHALAMGVAGPDVLAGLLGGAKFTVEEVSSAETALRDQPQNPLTDAVVYQSIGTMAAPEFIRDKARRIAIALGAAQDFPRAYALAQVYADEVRALEGVLLAPSEAAQFALVRMAVGDSVGAAQWLRAALGGNGGVSALPENEALRFIELVNLLAVLDPSTATQIARAANVSIVAATTPMALASHGDHHDAEVTAQILDAAFDAALDGKPGQAGLAALAASNGDDGQDGDVAAVVISQSLRAAGMPELRRRHQFERAWASSFAGDAEGPVSSVGGATDDGLTPRVKPAKG